MVKKLGVLLLSNFLWFSGFIASLIAAATFIFGPGLYNRGDISGWEMTLILLVSVAYSGFAYYVLYQGRLGPPTNPGQGEETLEARESAARAKLAADLPDLLKLCDEVIAVATLRGDSAKAAEIQSKKEFYEQLLREVSSCP